MQCIASDVVCSRWIATRSRARNPERFAPKDLLIRAGETEKYVFFIRKGLVREYLLMDNGDENNESTL